MGPAISYWRPCTPAVLALITILAWRPGPAAAEEILRAEAGIVNHRNLSQATSRSDIVSDTALNLDLSAGRYHFFEDGNSIALNLDLRAAEYQRFHGMSNLALGASASFRTKFGVGSFAPWARASGSLMREAYRENIRDGWRSSFSLQVGRRLTESLDVSGGGSLERYDADHGLQVVPGVSGDAFSIRGHNLFMRTDYNLGERWAGYASVNLRRGEVVASTRLDPEIFEYSSAVTRDPAFGADYIAYRLFGKTWSFLAGMSWAVNPHASLNFDVTRAITYAADEIGYRNTQFNAIFAYRY